MQAERCREGRWRELLQDDGKRGIGLAIPIDTVLEFLLQLDSAPSSEPEGSEEDHFGYGAAENSEEKQETEEDEQDTGPLLLKLALALSLVLNVLLSILLVCKKKKDRLPPTDPAERTDFEIDFLD